MSEPKSDANLVDDLAEEFACRWRAGERPSIEDYAARFPQQADEIRAVLPAVVMMEQLKPKREDAEPLVAPSPTPDRPPQRIGEFRIVREIGRGGMGVVYEAEQEALGRRVAIKVLPGRLLANETLRARFRREAQAAARLHHTNIVPVFGVGECDGQCFYVMQLINGRGLDRVIRERSPAGPDAPPETENAQGGSAYRQDTPTCDPLAGASDAPRPTSAEGPPGPTLSGLTPDAFCRAIARIGVQVADALADAHAQGVLHRDVKPSNLLLDERGTVWVTDFGVAKLVEEANLTQSGDLVGTLKYMPPERFAGQSEARGDVYSLGVTLYELLTQRSAFPDANPQHLIHLITREAPARPRKLNPHIPTDLETIVLKAAARDPAHRYQTPADLGDDLRRFLDDRPILAKRTGPVKLAWRWCRRNPALAAATATTFLLLAAVTVVSVYAYVETAAANRETRNALAAETTQREHAEHTSTLALEALNRIYDRFAPTRLVVTPQTGEEGEVEAPRPTLPPEAVPLLEDLLLTYERLALAGGEFPSLQSQTALANHRIGDICQRLGRFERAAAAYRTAVEQYTRLLADSGKNSVRIKLARVYNELGRTLRTLHQIDEAVRMHEGAIHTLVEAPQSFADRPECRYELACSYFTLGQRNMLLSPGPGGDGPGRPGSPGRGPPEGSRREGKRPPPRDRPGKDGGPRHGPHEEGGPPPDRPPGSPPGMKGPSFAQRAVDLLEQLVREFPSVPEYRHLLACCYRDAPPGKSNADRGVELLRQLIADFPRTPDYRFDLCETLARPGPPPRSGEKDGSAKKRERLQEAITLSAQLVAQYPNVPDYAAAHARYLDGLGMSLLQAEQFAESEKMHRKAVALQNRLVKQHPQVVAYRFWLGLMERSLGRVLGERGQLKEARALIESAVNRVEALWKKDSRLGAARPFLGMAYRDLARVHTRAGATALVEAALRKAQEFGSDHGPGAKGPREREGRRGR